MRKFVGLILVVLLALTVMAAGCSAAQPAAEGSGAAAPADESKAPAAETAAGGAENAGAAEGDVTFFINPKNIGPAYWAAAEKGALKAGEDLGVKVIFNAPSEADSSKQISMINDMIVNQVNGMGVSPNDAGAVIPVFEKAQAEGINVITWDSDSSDSSRSWYVAAEDDAVLAEQFVEQMAQEIGGKGKIVYMVAGLGAQNQIVKIDAANAYLEANYPDIEVVDVLASNDEQSKAYENAQNAISSHPDLDGIVSFAGAEAPAAAEAIQEAIDKGTLEPGRIALTGFGMPSLVKDYVESGIIEKFIVWDPGALGYATVSILNEMEKGTDVASLTELPNVGPIRVDGQNVYIGTIEITKDNIGDYDF